MTALVLVGTFFVLAVIFYTAYLEAHYNEQTSESEAVVEQHPVEIVPTVEQHPVDWPRLEEAAKLADEKYHRERRLRALEIADIDSMSGADFERYVAKLLTRRGFTVVELGRSGDLGIDIIAQRDNYKHAIQLKRHSGRIPRSAVSDAVAGRIHYKCDAAVVLTNNYFTSGAVELAQSTGCTLVNRDEPTEWIVRFQKEYGLHPSQIPQDWEASAVFTGLGPIYGALYALKPRYEALERERNKDISLVKQEVKKVGRSAPWIGWGMLISGTVAVVSVFNGDNVALIIGALPLPIGIGLALRLRKQRQPLFEKKRRIEEQFQSQTQKLDIEAEDIRQKVEAVLGTSTDAKGS